MELVNFEPTFNWRNILLLVCIGILGIFMIAAAACEAYQSIKEKIVKKKNQK